MGVLHGQDREREKRSHSLQERPLLRRLPEVERRRRPARPNPPANGWLPLLPCVRDFLQGGQAPGLQEPIQYIQGHQEHRLLAPGEQAREHRADGPVRGRRVPRNKPADRTSPIYPTTSSPRSTRHCQTKTTRYCATPSSSWRARACAPASSRTSRSTA